MQGTDEKRDLIHVGLYGGKSIFGGKETPLEASKIYCNKYNDCSYFKQGKCLMVRDMTSNYCMFGHVTTEKGYTSRAKKYHEFRSMHTSNEAYNRLKSAGRKLGVVNGHVYFPYPYVRLEVLEGSVNVCESRLFSNDNAFIPLSLFTTELIERIANYVPYALMGGVIESYQKEIVPLFLSHLKEVMPEKYAEYIEKYPNRAEKINYVGRKAFLHTVAPSIVKYKSDRYPGFNEEWEWDGLYLNYIAGHVSKVNVTKDYDVVEMKLKPSSTSIIEISSNDQVTVNTVFLD